MGSLLALSLSRTRPKPESDAGPADFQQSPTPISIEGIREAVLTHPNGSSSGQLLTMHTAPKRLLVNARVILDGHPTAAETVQTIAEIEEKLKQAEPKVDMIFLEAASLCRQCSGRDTPETYRLKQLPRTRKCS